jgi:hypothetical protein
MTRILLRLSLLVLACGALVRDAGAQALFRSEEPLTLTLTTNLRDLLRERDSTELRWFGAEMSYTDERGVARRVPTELRARGHFRRQARNCAFPPLFIRAGRTARDSSILQGNPRLKIVTPCRPTAEDYQQYILLEYLMYRTYPVINEVHHRTRLANITYKDSTDRVKPIVVTAFFLEVEQEVADEYGLEFSEQTGALFADVDSIALDRLSLFEYWIGNTDWSLAALHNIELFRKKDGDYIASPTISTGREPSTRATRSPIRRSGSARCASGSIAAPVARPSNGRRRSRTTSPSARRSTRSGRCRSPGSIRAGARTPRPSSTSSGRSSTIRGSSR